MSNLMTELATRLAVAAAGVVAGAIILARLLAGRRSRPRIDVGTVSDRWLREQRGEQKDRFSS